MSEEKDRCSNNLQCHLAMNLNELEIKRVEFMEMKKLKWKEYKKIIEKKPILTPYIVCLLVLGILLIISSVI